MAKLDYGVADRLNQKERAHQRFAREMNESSAVLSKQIAAAFVAEEPVNWSDIVAQINGALLRFNHAYIAANRELTEELTDARKSRRLWDG